MKKFCMLLILVFVTVFALASCGHAKRRTKSGFWSERPDSAFTWQEAVEYCENLNEDGFDNWRLPTKYELFEIARKHEFGSRFGDKAILWSATESNVSGNLSVVVNFTTNDEGEFPKESRFALRCIR
ncbi:DUF1566 domain-containing protein [bacterium]|nr:DUF1566 domain-containing protein [bacterium]